MKVSCLDWRVASLTPTDKNRHPGYVPKPPSMQAVPQRELGTRPARALPYELQVDGQVVAGSLQLSFRSTGTAGAVFQVRSGSGQAGPWTYTVGARDETSDSFGASGAASYDFWVYGPNGFLRAFAGSFGAGSANLTIKTIYDRQLGGISLVIQNVGSNPVTVSVFDAYSGQPRRVSSDAGFQRQLAGQVETGRPSVSDPAIGG